MQGMFNGAAVVTHERVPFVEVLKRVRISGRMFGYQNAKKC
jgi:hypothetical protein